MSFRAPFRFVAVLAGLVLTLASAAQADVILGNYPPTNDNTQTAFVNQARQKAIGFITPSSSIEVENVILRLEFTALNQVPVLGIWSNSAANQPGTLLHSFTNPASFSLGIDDYTFDSSGFTLEPDTRYWLRLSGAIANNSMNWKASSPAVTPTGLATFDGNLFTTDGGSTWSSSSIISTFQINGVVPEPGSLGVLAAGGALLLVRRRR